MVVLLLACTVVLMVRRGRKKVALLHKHTALVSSSTKPGVTINMKDLKMNMALSTPIINNGLSRSRVAAAKNKVGLTWLIFLSMVNTTKLPLVQVI
jgi:discoidin domain receptor family protein 2